MSPVSAGTRLGPYEIVAPIGAGGMGEVFKARDTRLDRSVAIKMLPAHFAHDAQLRVRFEREAKAISALNHPNICTLYDVGADYLVMEFLEGESLAERLSKGPLPLPDVLKYGEQLAEALERAHRAGIVHRDLKPANVMLTKSGAKLLDFGLAKQSLIALSIDGATQRKSLTQEGTILGTFQYMAPEQLEGTEAGARTDIFAFGALLYEMITGKRAFEGKTKTSLIAAIVGSTPPPVSQLRPLTPRAIDHVVAKCLEKDPDDRWQSAHDIGEELRWIAQSGNDLIPSQETRRREALAWVIALLALTGAGLWTGMRRTVVPQPYSFFIPPSTAEYDFAYGGIISPDGRSIAFSAERRTDGNRVIWVRPVDSLEARQLPAAESWSSFFWGHDSRHIYFGPTGLIGTKGKFQKLAVDGGTPQVIGEFPPIAGGDTNSNGDVIVAATRGLGIHRVTKSGALVPLTSLDASHNEQRHNWPQFLPDGRHFLFTAVTLDPGDAGNPHRLYVGSLDGPAKYIDAIPSRVQYANPGYLLFVRDGTLLAARFDLEKLDIIGEPVTVVDDVWYHKSDGHADFWVSKNGTLIVKGSGLPYQINSVTASGQIGRALGATTMVLDQVDISPDGRSLALSMPDEKVANNDLWLWGLDRPAQRRLTFNDSAERAPVWTPDGTRLYYSSDAKSEPDIYVRTIEGQGEGTLVLSAPDIQAPRDVSPDGRYLLYQSYEDPSTDGDLMVIALDVKNEQPRPFVKTPARDGGAGRFSPDGRWVLYTSSEMGREQVYVKPFPGGGNSQQVSTEAGRAPRWSADGKRIYYFQGDRKLHSALFDAATGKVSEPVLVADLPRNVVTYDARSDGSFIVVMPGPPETWAANRVFTDWTRLLKEK